MSTRTSTTGIPIISKIDTSIADPLARVQSFLTTDGSKPLSFGDTLTPNLRLLTATSSPAQVTFTFTVTLALCNALQNLHGGAAALIFDVTTTCAVVPLSKPGFWENAGVTRSLNCSYLRPLPEGSVVTVEARVVQVGRRLVSVVGVMRGEGGEVAVMCEHTKMVVDGEGGRGKL